MKRLLLMRHGHSSWTHEVDDHDRPLSARGIQEATHAGQRLSQLDWQIDLALVSSALRTQETWKTLVPLLGYTVSQQSDQRLYLAGLGTIQPIVGNQQAENILLLGHNPGWSATIQRLTGRSVQLDTAHVAILEHTSDDWNTAIHDDGWTLRHHFMPSGLS